MFFSDISKLNSIKGLKREQVVDLFIIAMFSGKQGLEKIIEAIDEEVRLISSMQECQLESNVEDENIKKLNRSIKKILQNVSKHQQLLENKFQDILEISII